MEEKITYGDFEKIDFRVGTIIEVIDFPEARKPAYKIKVDFGSDIGIQQSSVQIKHLYQKGELMGKQVVAIVNLPPKQIGPFISEVLVTGFDGDGGVVLTTVDKAVNNGTRLY